jgi:hypothetical protein
MNGGRPRRALVRTHREIAGTVYGTIVAMGAMAAGSHTQTDAARLAAAVAGTVFVLWIAHVYSHAVGETIALGRRLDRAELADVARRELPIPLAAVGPIAVLLLGAVGVFRERTAVLIAFGLALALLFVQGLRYARVERFSRAATAVSVVVNVSLGLAIVALEAALSH